MAEISRLPSEAETALKNVKEWLSKRDFNDLNGLQFYSGPELVEECKVLLGFLPAQCKESFDPQKRDTRVTAIRIHKSTTTVPVKEGSGGLLIPVNVGVGATVGGQVLHELDYAELKGGVVATPDFYALLLLSRAIA
ncbi:hypothetical protein EKO27_g6839 [Xylaria grammica]|uniref:Uncharacterized protein n=1 Tax=Xylaria grammica TaxID=363999 RepID=A0A439D214_9PEZI|nr:hypothetical protein EKO27_g6839 [Xylaria grammica]